MRYLIIFILVQLCNPIDILFAQENLKIEGYIYTLDKLPLGNATLKLTKSGKTTVSDSNGYFNIQSIQSFDTLAISKIGYHKQIFLVNTLITTPVSFFLEADVQLLEEVMVNTGYQTLPKERSTGSFYKIDKKLFNQSLSTDVISRLDGISSGLLFDKRDGNATNIQIRGLSSLLSESQQPLIILDNFPYEGLINNINPNDVEDITILKDASASSIWGARAGNGVIVITTKKGKFNQPTTVFFNTNATMFQKPNLNKMSLIPSTDYIDLEKFLFNQGFYEDKINYPEYYPLTPVVEILADKSLTDDQAAQKIDKLRSIDVRDDFHKNIYQIGLNRQYALNLNGGGDKIRYYMSAGVDNNRTNLIGDDYSRISVKSSSTFKPLKRLQLQADISYTKSKNSNNSPGGYASNYNIGTMAIYPYAQLANKNGDFLSLDNQFSRKFTDTVGEGKLLDWKYYPLKELSELDNSSKVTDILMNFGITYEISPAINAEVKYQYETSFNNARNYMSLNSFYTRDLINRYTNLYEVKAEFRNPIPIGGILDLTNSDLMSNSIRGQLNLHKNWSVKNEVNAVAGIEIREANTKLATNRTYGYDPKFLSFKNVDYVNDYKTYNDIFGNTSIPDNNKFSELLYRYISTYANISYSFDTRYTFSASARKDASNIFGVDANDKGTPLWSLGVAWDISKEKFWNPSFISYLKIRSTYGYSGNTNQSVSALTVLQYLRTSSSIVNFHSADILNASNPELRWEKVRMYNAGVDFAIKGNRLTGSLEYYSKNSIDLLTTQTLDVTTGLGSIITNSGNMKGNGIDLVLNGTIIDKKIKWFSTLLFNHSTYRISKVLNDSKRNGYTSDGSGIIALEGYNPYEVISNKWAGLDPITGDPQGIINGLVSKDYKSLQNKSFDEQVKHGSGLPLYFGNLRNTISYGKFALTFNIAYSFDFHFVKPTINYTSLLNYGTVNGDYLTRWQKPGDEVKTNVLSFVYPTNSDRDTFYQLSEINVLRGDNIRFKEIYLEYSLNEAFLKRFSIKGCRLYANISNLDLVLWKANKANIDPNYPNGLKLGKSTSIGLNINL